MRGFLLFWKCMRSVVSLKNLGSGVRLAGLWFLNLLFASQRTFNSTVDLQVQISSSWKAEDANHVYLYTVIKITQWWVAWDIHLPALSSWLELYIHSMHTQGRADGGDGTEAGTASKVWNTAYFYQQERESKSQFTFCSTDCDWLNHEQALAR